MIKRLCDICGNEITDALKPSGGSVAGRLGGMYRGISFEILVGKAIRDTNNCSSTSWNQGDFCSLCIIDAVTSIRDKYIIISKAKQSSKKR